MPYRHVVRNAIHRPSVDEGIQDATKVTQARHMALVRVATRPSLATSLSKIAPAVHTSKVALPLLRQPSKLSRRLPVEPPTGAVRDTPRRPVLLRPPACPRPSQINLYSYISVASGLTSLCQATRQIFRISPFLFVS